MERVTNKIDRAKDQNSDREKEQEESDAYVGEPIAPLQERNNGFGPAAVPSLVL